MLKMFLHGRVLATLALVAACAGLPPAGFAADMNKVIRQVFPAAETGFDPAAAHDLYSATVEQAIFETLLTYDYLARPAKLVPLTAEAMPVVTDNGKTYTIKLRKGIYFAPDPAFKGKKRELIAEDYAYELKRLIDPRTRSPWTWLVEGKIVGPCLNRSCRRGTSLSDHFNRRFHGRDLSVDRLVGASACTNVQNRRCLPKSCLYGCCNSGIGFAKLSVVDADDVVLRDHLIQGSLACRSSVRVDFHRPGLIRMAVGVGAVGLCRIAVDQRP